MKLLSIKITQLIIVLSLAPVACKKKDTTVTIPSVTTIEASAITPSSAITGGTITDQGGIEIMSSGVCYSKSNPLPVITDDTTNMRSNSLNFVSNLTNLQPSSIYYARAYAVNRAGVGYGNVIMLTTGNGPPDAVNVSVSGLAEVNRTLTASYIYSDVENDPESGSSFQWYMANGSSGNGEVPIAGATSLTYTIQSSEQSKYIRIGITPRAASGTQTGVEVKSNFIGPVGDATTVTFVYNGSTVTYNILTSTVTGRKWLDRNLGAPNTPGDANDFANYGDLFQWGRLADGHQLIIYSGNSNAQAAAVNGIVATASNSDNPGHSNFIRSSVIPLDWRNPRNNTLWQGLTGINNPCPSGWRLPTREEWEAEGLTNITVAYNRLKLTNGGFRSPSSGNFSEVGVSGRYWSSSVVPSASPSNSYRITLTGTSTTFNSDFRAAANSCRCIRD